MKKIIILQNSPVFTVDIAKIFNPNFWELHLLANKESYNHLHNRNQHILFNTITIIHDFNFNNLKNNIIPIINNVDKESVVFATNSESLVGITGQLREYFNIPGVHTNVARIFTDKVVMKKHLSSFNILLPNYIDFNFNEYSKMPTNYIKKISQKLSFPIIAKPIDSAGSNGVRKINNINELAQWATSIEKNGFELDEYITGELYHCDSFVHNGNILYTAVCHYSSPPHKFLLGHNLGSITLPNNDICYQELKKFNDYVLKNISTDFNGVTHLEVFKKDNGELIFLEIAYRGGGAGIPHMYQKHLNIDLFSTHFLLQSYDDYQLNIYPSYYSAWIQFSPSSNVINIKDIPKTKSEISLVSRNEKINANSPCFSLRDYSLLIVLWNNNFTQLQQDFAKLSQLALKTQEKHRNE
ncbi:MAG: ATP-grasp domain-containing protein [Gammaproteobacteria bacterium]|nr:MAG: ATP-grasp domain-containing protein [Gammaproteobacteria bacterium]